jgi:hypothetical protein
VQLQGNPKLLDLLPAWEKELRGTLGEELLFG